MRRRYGGLLMAALLGAVGTLEAQGVDTTLRLPRGKVLELSGTSGSVELRTWVRPEVRLQLRGAGATRVRLHETASRVWVEEGLGRADSVTWLLRDSAGRVIGSAHVMSSGPVVMPQRGPLVERGRVGPPDSARRLIPTVERGRVTGDTSRRPVVIGDDTLRAGASFRGTLSGTFGWRPLPQASVDYVITVPERSHVVLRGGTVEISVQGPMDTLELSNTRGTIRVSDVTGHLTLTSLEGRVLVERGDGDVFARTLGGSVVLRGVSGRVEAQGVAGSVELSDVTAREVTARTYEGGIRLQGALPRNGNIRLSTFTGAISLPTTGPCAQVVPGTSPEERTPASGERLDLLLTTTTPAGVTRGPATCTLRRE